VGGGKTAQRILDLDRDELARGLAASPLVRQWIWREQIGSTQRLAQESAGQQGAGLLIIAEAQTEGRGREGRRWFSPPGQGLWFSLVLQPARPAQEWPLLTSVAALALRGAVREATGLSCSIKWPNDLIWTGRKVAGILADVAQGLVILGVGLNVSLPTEALPPDLQGEATSIRAAGGQPGPRGGLLLKFLAHLEVYLGRFETGDRVGIRNDLRTASLLIGRTVQIAAAAPTDSGRRELRGRVHDIGPLGELLLRPVPAGANPAERATRPVTVSSGRILWIDPPLGEGI
jgi:BirA family biotin operon repressor/biotin-[acetyl-CoA-carboxylase] ligase